MRTRKLERQRATLEREQRDAAASSPGRCARPPAQGGTAHEAVNSGLTPADLPNALFSARPDGNRAQLSVTLR